MHVFDQTPVAGALPIMPKDFTDLNGAERLHSKLQTPYGQRLGYKRPYQRGDFDFAMITYGSNV